MLAENYGSALKRLIKFTKSKSTYVAEHIGYDVSYISKWSHGSKLPSSRSIERINDELGQYFATAITQQGNCSQCYKQFSLVPDDDDLASEISQYLSAAYRSSLQKKQMPITETKASVRIITGHHNIMKFLAETLSDRLRTVTGNQELIIYGEFCDLYDAEFWSYLGDTTNSAHIDIRVGLDVERLKREPQYLKYLYGLLNKCLNMDFTFYHIKDMDDANMILLKDQFVIQYVLQQHRGFTICTYINGPAMVQDMYERLSLQKSNKDILLAPMDSPWTVDSGRRTNFYTTGQFFFFLTNGIEYLLPPKVFQDILAKAPADKVFSIERLHITWEEILNKADLDIIVPTACLLRYVETGKIDLTDIQYTMSPLERKNHMDYALEALKGNPHISVGMIDLASKNLAYAEANLAFYSNIRSGFFKKNPVFVQNKAKPFYVILNDTLHALILGAFQNLKHSPQYHHYDEPELAEKYEQYKPLIEKLLSLHT